MTVGPGEESFAGQAARKIDGAAIMLGLTIPELGGMLAYEMRRTLRSSRRRKKRMLCW